MKKGFRFVYFGAAAFFIAGVVAQVFLAGMTVVAGQLGWESHIGLGHILALPVLIMVISMYIGSFPGQMKRLTWVLFGVYVLQADIVIFLRDQLPLVSALHPVLALVDFTLALTLVRRSWGLAMQGQDLAELKPE
jgi:hypothetical protein